MLTYVWYTNKQEWVLGSNNTTETYNIYKITSLIYPFFTSYSCCKYLISTTSYHCICFKSDYRSITEPATNNDIENNFPSLLSKISSAINVETLKSSRTNLTPEIKQPHGAKTDSATCTRVIWIIRPFTETHVHYFAVCLSLSHFSITETENEHCELMNDE